MLEENVITCEIVWLAENEGGRKLPPVEVFSNGKYRPHIVIGDPSQREAIIGDKNLLLEDYLGIAFVGAPEQIKAGEPFVAQIQLIYFPFEGYNKLVNGITFTIREGSKIVGYGKVLKEISN